MLSSSNTSFNYKRCNAISLRNTSLPCAEDLKVAITR